LKQQSAQNQIHNLSLGDNDNGEKFGKVVMQRNTAKYSK